MWAIWFLACENERPSDPTMEIDPADDCADGFDLGEDGNCYEVRTNPDPMDLVFANLPVCTLEEPADDFDVGRACVNGACAGESFADAEAALGPAYLCNEYSSTYVYCTWDAPRVGVVTPGADRTPDADGTVYRVDMMFGYEGVDEDGLALAISLACWLDVMPDPDYIEFAQDGSDWEIYDMWWDSGIQLFDYVDDRGDEGSDGYADWLYLYE